jgi:hypothetical protein
MKPWPRHFCYVNGVASRAENRESLLQEGKPVLQRDEFTYEM